MKKNGLIRIVFIATVVIFIIAFTGVFGAMGGLITVGGTSLISIAVTVIWIFAIVKKILGFAKNTTQTEQEIPGQTTLGADSTQNTTYVQPDTTTDAYGKDIEDLNGGTFSKQFCPYCGVPITSELKECSNCGKRIHH